VEVDDLRLLGCGVRLRGDVQGQIPLELAERRPERIGVRGRNT